MLTLGSVVSWCSISLTLKGSSMIIGQMLTWSRMIFLQEFTIDWHHKYVVVRIFWVDCLYYKRSFPFRSECAFIFVCHTMGRRQLRPNLPSEKFSLWLFCWRPSRFEPDKAQYTVEPITASRLVLQSLGDVTDGYFISNLGCQSSTKWWYLNLQGYNCFPSIY